MMMNKRAFLAALCVPMLWVGTVWAQPVVVNGDFELNSDAFTVWPGYIGGGNPEAIEGWTSGGGIGLNPISTGEAPFRDNGNNDTHVALLQGESSIEQTVSGFTPGLDYVLTVEFNSRNCCEDVPIGEIYLNDILAASSLDLPFPDGGIVPVGEGGDWYVADIPFTAPGEDVTVRIATRPLAGGDSTMLVDNVRISAVPEPASIGTFLVGLLGLALRRSRK